MQSTSTGYDVVVPVELLHRPEQPIQLHVPVDDRLNFVQRRAAIVLVHLRHKVVLLLIVGTVRLQLLIRVKAATGHPKQGLNGCCLALVSADSGIVRRLLLSLKDRT